MQLLLLPSLFLLAAGFTSSPARGLPNSGANSVVLWQDAAVRAGRAANQGAPVIARALAVVGTCMYDAWAAYDGRAVGTELRGVLRRPERERSEANKERAISYAAYRALVDLLPQGTESSYKPLMRELGYDPNDESTDIETPTGIGNVACLAVLEFRHHDKSNQLGDMPPAGSAAGTGTRAGAYGDWTGYHPVNPPSTVPARLRLSKSLNLDHWQPLAFNDSTGSLMLQTFQNPQWCYVAPFAMTNGDSFRSALEPGPFKYGSPEYQSQVEELVNISANLTDRQKMIAEYWWDGPRTVQPPGHWVQFALMISARDHHSLDDDVRMFFALNNAMLDAGIAGWDAKRAYDSVRPVTAIEALYSGKTIRAWGGPRKGTVEMDGSQWIPYQSAMSPTPPFPDFVSGHSTYSAAAARILALWTGSDHFGQSVVLASGSSKIEPGITPAHSVILKWVTFTEAADEAGMSRRYGGIHFARADLAGRKLGRLVADCAWAKAQSYFDGSAAGPAPTFEASVDR